MNWGEILAYFWFIALALVWGIYVVQEMFSVGGGLLAFRYFKDDNKFKEYNRTFGTHWDGIQVWVILAIGGLFATFPQAFAQILTALYIPIFLLIYAIFFRGIAIEVIYKTENKKWQNVFKWTWVISSGFLIAIIAIYLNTLFTGFPNDPDTLNNTFFSFLFVFNLTSILVAVNFIANSIVLGHLFMKLNSSAEFVKKNENIAFVSSVTSLATLALIITAYNNKYKVFSDGLFADYPILYFLVALIFLGALIGVYGVWKKKTIIAFGGHITAVLLFIMTGFIAMIPYITIIQGPEPAGLLITDAAATTYPLAIMAIATLIFLPIVIGYQIWKYKKFWGKLDDF